jgi:hypothetical protein
MKQLNVYSRPAARSKPSTLTMSSQTRRATLQPPTRAPLAAAPRLSELDAMFSRGSKTNASDLLLKR